jgi:hypothetical protein
MAAVSVKAKKWTRENIMELTREEVFELWKQCPAAQMTELVGEFDGLIPNAGDEERQRGTAEVMYNENSRTGYWLGKAFWPLSKTKGDGYNRYRHAGGRIEYYMRFGTEMGTSLIDGKPSLMMYYGAYHLRLLPAGQENTLTDEIRKLADGIYLGMGTVKLPNGSRSEPGHFILVGPVGEYRRADNPTEELK